MYSAIDVIRKMTPEQIATIAIRHKWCHLSTYPCTDNPSCYSCWMNFLNSKTRGYNSWLEGKQKSL